MAKVTRKGFDLEGAVRHDLRSFPPYQAMVSPGALPGDARAANGEVIKLDGNENVYGCSPRVQAALATFSRYHIYPDADQRDLRAALATYTGLDAAHLIVGSGSDELIDLLFRLVLNAGDNVISASPTFGMYEVNTTLCGGKLLDVPRDADYRVNPGAILEAITPQTKAIILACPNNPTGTPTPRRDIETLLEAGRLVIADEAYFEFSGQTVADLVPAHENLVVLRTFSKWAGLAGLRVGYGLMSPALVQRLMAIKPPYNVNVAANVAALESLKDQPHLKHTVALLVKERERLNAKLGEIAFLKPVPSVANFILCRVIGRDARQLQLGLRKKGIYIRYYRELPEFVRISVGTPEHTDLLIQSLKE